MTVGEINPGDLVHLTNAPGFKNTSGTLTDPTTVTLRWRVDGGAETVWLVAGGQIVKDSTGLYHADIPATTVGVYSGRWEGVGALVATSEWSFTVTTAYATAAAPATGTYAGLDMFREYLRANAVGYDTADPDSVFETIALHAASRAIEEGTGRRFNGPQAAPSARYYTPRWIAGQAGYFGRWVCDIDDVSDPTGLTVFFDSSGNGTYVNQITSFRTGPADNPSRGFPYNRLIFDIGTWVYVRGEEAVQVNTPNWGWAAVPQTIVNATMLQAARYIKRRDAAFGVTGSPDMGTQIRLLSKLDPDVALMLSHYNYENVA